MKALARKIVSGDEDDVETMGRGVRPGPGRRSPRRGAADRQRL